MTNGGNKSSSAGLIASYDNYGTATDCYFYGSGPDVPVRYYRSGYQNYFVLTRCFYNSSLMTGSYTAQGKGLTTAQFAVQSNFSGWDFTNTWIMKDGRPELRVFLSAEEIYALEHPST